jgi:predicted MFS family arabinose efflux permease
MEADPASPSPPDSVAGVVAARRLLLRRDFVELAALFATFYFLQGICEPTEGMLSQPIMSLYKRWGFDTEQIGRFSFVLGLPWAIKLGYGLLTDFVPIFDSRRKAYLLIMSGLSTCAFTTLASMPMEPGMVYVLLGMLLLSSVGVAFCDVVIDAIMVERGQPLGITGLLQSTQWTSIYAAAILGGWLGGQLSQYDAQPLAFAICAAVTSLTFALTTLGVREHRSEVAPPAEAGRTLISELRHARIWAIAAFLYLWTFNPFSSKVLYVHMTRDAGFSESFYGETMSIMAVGQLLGALMYGLYCRRIPWRLQLHLSIVMGIAATAAYWWLGGEPSARLISFFVGITYSTGTMIQLDLAARHCPPEAAGTAFAVLMAVSNLGMSSSDWSGGTLYKHWESWGAANAFHALVAVGCATTAGCWLLVPWLTRQPRSIAGEELATG